MDHLNSGDTFECRKIIISRFVNGLHLDYYDIVVALRMALVAVGAFDRQVALGNIEASNVSLNDNFMTLYLAEKLGMELPILGPDFTAFMANLTPVEPKD